MPTLPHEVQAFLSDGPIAVAGVSTDTNQPANHILRRLRDTGHATIALNPKLTEAEGQPCYPDFSAIDGAVHSVMIVTHPDVSASVVEDAADHGVKHVWFHRSFGEGSVSEAALQVCRERELEFIEGGCPMMFCGNVDVAHRCIRWWLQRKGRAPR